MSARLRGLFGRWLAAAVALCLLVTGAALAAGPLAHEAAKPRRADLVVRAAGAKLAQGRLTVSVTASNAGRARARASTGAVAWKPVKARKAVRLRTFRVPALRAGDRRPLTITVTVPTGESGDFAVSVCLDVRAKVRETSGKNNCRSAGKVTVAAGLAGDDHPASGPLVSVSSPTSGPVGASGSPGQPAPTPPEPAPLDTQISRGPVGVTGSRTETILFSATQTGVTFECRLDAGAWTACTTPKVLTSLADGPHTFEVRAIDATGHADPTPASRSWTVDGSPPDTSITSGPSGSVNATSATFDFTSSKSDGSFECRIDGGAWGFCTAPHDVPNLTAGIHTFEVRATDSRGTVDATPASRTWTVDLIAPQTVMTSGPSPGATTGPGTAFGFSSEAGATFECRVDSGLWAACSSALQLSGLADGPHTFEVRAIDSAGNPDLTPASRAWTVDATAPETTIDSGPSATVGSASASFTFSSADAGATFECRIDGGAWAACASPRAYASLADGSHTFDVRATDAVGNVDATPASRTWSVDTTAPQTSIDSGPTGTVNGPEVAFTFSSTEPGSAFQCSLDNAAFAACTSPATYGGLPDGAHTFAVQAIDATGNVDQTPAFQTWTVAVAP